MNERDAKALGRWCDTHKRVFERVHLEGAEMTGCRECLTGDGEKAVAMREAIRAVQQHYGIERQSP